ncbi:TIGR04104 family putative zinc finger protein [Alkalihalobacillus sp. MEB130]|uniref:TIGR04104 family putative zinc finger protein n=1 Tax=Alkalihalobacillus sp. MEB130 TaxID=2976704 RepID=UPI0037C02FED
MQQCEKCETPFTWRHIFSSSLWGYRPIHCRQCDLEHKITIWGRFTFVFLTLVPFYLFTMFLSPFTTFFYTFSIGVIILIIGSVVTPYFLKYKAR